MSLPVVEIPRELRKLMKPYRKNFTKPQFKQFRKLITGLIVSDKKTIQEINDCFNDTDQSSLNKFVTLSPWDEEAVNKIRIKQAKDSFKLSNGILIIDPTMLHKTGKHMEKANYHRSGKTKKIEWGHFLVDSFFVDGEDAFPLKADIYIREEDADKEHPFKTAREIGMEHIDYAIESKLPFDTVMADAGLYADFVLRHIKDKELFYVIGTRVTNKISLNNHEKRISINDYLWTITDSNFSRHIIDGEVYYLHVKEIYTRGVGKELLLISYKQGDEDTIKIYTTNILNYSDEELMSLLLERWRIEGLHRDTKQHLGLEDYQVRKYRGIQRVVLAILVAYTLIVLSKCQSILNPLKRTLETIGEGCRFFRLIAVKGWRWLKRNAGDVIRLKDIMNKYVFVKNAKV